MSGNGYRVTPERYANDGKRETIDRIRDSLGDVGFIAWCEGNVIKYMDRLGKKDADDAEKQSFYMEMAEHVRGCMQVGYARALLEYPDPRSGRRDFLPYARCNPGTKVTPCVVICHECGRLGSKLQGSCSCE